MPERAHRYLFGPYEVRMRARELYKHGTKLKLRPQPFQILLMLAEHAPDAVTREDLRQALWPAETFVDFEHGLNTAIKELRAALNDSVSKPRYIETLTKVGYRMVIPVEAVAAAEAASPAAPTVMEPVSVEPEPKPRVATAANEATAKHTIRKLWRWSQLAAVCIVLLTCLGAYKLWQRSKAHSQEPVARVMLAVLPFENLTGDPAQEYFSDGLTEEMITQLGRLVDSERFGLIARASVMHYKQRQTSLNQIGNELGVQYVLEGSVRRDASRIRISAQLIRVQDQTQLWGQEFDRELESSLSVQSEIAQAVAAKIEGTLGESRQAAKSAHIPVTASSYEAYDLYLKGLFFWNQRGYGFSRAAEYFQQAIAKDPNFARAHAGLANTYGLLSTWYIGKPADLMPKARAEAIRAVQLDESLPEAHVALALIAESYDYDWQGAEKEFRRAIELDPNNVTAHQWFGEFLSFQGRFEEALSESERARQLDPMSLIVASDRGAVFYRARQYDRAIAEERAVLEADPKFFHAYGYLLESYLQTGRYTEAFDEINRYIRPWSARWADGAEAIAYSVSGRRLEAERALARFQKGISPNEVHELILIYIAMGRRNQALALLQRLFDERSHVIAILKTDPEFDPLRSDPRFQAILRRVHLDQ